jgi:hypothetical protein
VVAVSFLSLSLDSWGFLPNRNEIFVVNEDQVLPTPTEGTAVIVFVHPGDVGDFVGGVVTGGLLGLGKKYSLIYDVTSDTPKLLGAIQRGIKVAYELPAGRYMLQSKNLLAVNVTAGRTYYIHADDPGLAAGMITGLTPVRNGGEGKWQYSSESFQTALKYTVLATTHPVTQEYFGKEKWLKAATNFNKKFLKKWNKKSESERQELTLHPEDGVFAESYPKQVPPLPEAENAKAHSSSYDKELEALEALRDDGIFTEEEFQRQKAKLMQKEKNLP